MKYSDYSNDEILDASEMFDVKRGYVCYGYGCDSNVRAKKRSGAKELCDTAYCRSGVGFESPSPTLGLCRKSV